MMDDSYEKCQYCGAPNPNPKNEPKPNIKSSIKSSVKKVKGVLSKVPGKLLYTALIGIIFVIEYFILQFIFPADIRHVIFDNIEALYKTFLSTLQPVLEQPLGATLVGFIPFLIIAVIFLVWIFIVSEESLKVVTRGLFFGVIIVANLLLGIFFAIGQATGGTDQLVCYLKTGFTNPEQCYGGELPEAPAVKKVGEGCETNPSACYQVLELHFGTYPDFKPPLIYVNDMCSVDASITNIAKPERTVTGVVAGGKIRNDTCERVGGCIKLIPESCTNDEPCEIPMSTYPFTLSLDCEKPIPFRVNSFVDVIFEATYPVKGQGSNDFNIFKSSAQVSASEPESAPGPVDVVVYFSPNYLTVRNKNEKINLIVEIQNKLNGKAFVDKVKIVRFSEFKQLGDAECFPQWDRERKWKENEWFELKTDVPDRIRLICELKVNQPLELPNSADSAGVKFFAYVDYTYTQRHLESVKVLKTIT